MPNPHDPESEHHYKWYFKMRSGEWEGTPKEIKRPSFKPIVETQATFNGIEVRKVGSNKWIPASDIINQHQK